MESNYDYAGVIVNNVMYVHAEMYAGARSAGYEGEDFILTQEEQSQKQPTGSPLFSVSATKSVKFAPGNLQYQASTKTWRFAENQYDYIGADNANISNSYSGWIDLFCWSTNKTYFGVSTSMEEASFYGDFVDWGKNIINGDKANTWRTLTIDEWSYICLNRPNASKLQGVASVNGIGGMVLLPDDWVCPIGIKFVSGFATDGFFNYSALNEYSTSQWQKMEDAGAVFLPVTGMRLGDGMSYNGKDGRYWSASSYATNNACDVIFDSHTWYDIPGDVSWGRGRSAGLAVRLVKVDSSDIEDKQDEQKVDKLEEQTEDKLGEQCVSGYENNHAYVDLGLSVKWATCNIGASTREAFGSYFAWGETSPKSNYIRQTYKLCTGDFEKMTKYCIHSALGIVDGKTTLELCDDAAHMKWGGNWRMPTKDELEELITECTCTLITRNGSMIGCKITGKNGNSIYLPGADCLYGSTIGRYRDCYYWSSSLNEDYSYSAWYLRIYRNCCHVTLQGRFYGLPIRAVCK